MSAPTPPSSSPAAPSGPPPTSAPPPTSPPGRSLWRALTVVLLLLLSAAAGAGAAWGILEWRLAQSEQQAAARLAEVEAELARQRESLAQEQEELRQHMARVEQAVADARLVVGDDTLAEKLAEIDALQQALEQERLDAAQRLEHLTETLRQEMGISSQESAAAVAAELRLRSQLQAAAHRVLKAKVDLAEQNAGLAREELHLAGELLDEALTQTAPEQQQALQAVLDLVEETQTALAVGAGTARSQLDLLWQRLGELLAQPDGLR